MGRPWVHLDDGAGDAGAQREPWKLPPFCFRPGRRSQERPEPMPRWAGCRRPGFLSGAGVGCAVSDSRRGDTGYSIGLRLVLFLGSPWWPRWGLWGAHTGSRVGSGLSLLQPCLLHITAGLQAGAVLAHVTGQETEEQGRSEPRHPARSLEPGQGPAPRTAESACSGIQNVGPGSPRPLSCLFWDEALQGP